MTNKAIARLLKDTALLIDLTGGNSFRARAFENVSRTIERLEEPVTDRLKAGTLTEIKGIGAGLASQIEEIVQTGSFDVRDQLMAAVPPGVLDIMRVKGLGAKKVRLLWQGLDITSLPELEDAARANRLANLDGFGAKTQQKILQEIELRKKYSSKRRYADALSTAHAIQKALADRGVVDRIELSGEIRRKLEAVDRVDLIAAAADPAAVREAVAAMYPSLEVRDETPEVLLLATPPDGLPIRIVLTPPERFGTVQWRTTGSEAHCDAFESRYGQPETAAEEEEIYSRVGLPFVAPELRENTGEFEAAAQGVLPALIDDTDLKGTLHNHTTYSDGAHTLEQMAGKARQMGLEYIGVCDHSRSLVIANGLSIERVIEQQEEIQRLNDRFKAEGVAFRIFSGTESDILTDGSLDYPDEILATFDLVVASIHSGFSMTQDQATDRLIRAIENPYTTILGHATGRLILSREGYAIDHERVIDACVANEVSIELNANPYRLDMDWRWVHHATDKGALISINPDAHSMDELLNTRWGVCVARKGWLTAAQCLNAKPVSAFEAWLQARRRASV